LILSGSNSINGTGNSAANEITGNAGADVLNGAAGNDILRGGSGEDTLLGGVGTDSFIFDTALAAGNVDVVNGYNMADDTMKIDNAIFKGLGVGVLLASAFAKNTSGQLLACPDRVVLFQS
jgi:Ca2+-binding RTX toxin-like protein